MGGINFDDLQWEKRYSPTPAYAQSKSANLMFALELDRRSRAAGWGIVSNAAHPGFTKTNLQLSGPSHGRDSPTLMERFYRREPPARRRSCGRRSTRASCPRCTARRRPAPQGGTFYGPRGFLEAAGGGVKHGQDSGALPERGRLPAALGGLRATDRGELPDELNFDSAAALLRATVVVCRNPASSCGPSRWTADRIPPARGCRRPDCVGR